MTQEDFDASRVDLKAALPDGGKGLGRAGQRRQLLDHLDGPHPADTSVDREPANGPLAIRSLGLPSGAARRACQRELNHHGVPLHQLSEPGSGIREQAREGDREHHAVCRILSIDGPAHVQYRHARREKAQSHVLRVELR